MKKQETTALKTLEDRFDKHLEIYAENGKELARVATNQEWLMKFFWLLMTPLAGGMIYIILNLQ